MEEVDAVNNTLGARLKEAREKKRLTQMEVAKKLGISNGTLSGYERNYRDPDTNILAKLSALYEVSVDWLTGNIKNPITLTGTSEREEVYLIKETNAKYEYFRELEKELKELGVELSDPDVQKKLKRAVKILFADED
jgi:transcriptional regulator with XRE-family HTH domain